MRLKRNEECDLMLYKIISQLLSDEYKTKRSNVEDILNAYLEECCDRDLQEDLREFFSSLIAYAESKISIGELLAVLREALHERKLRSVAIIAFREICDLEIAEISRDWLDDLEPSVRMAYLKCLLKLFERGEVGVEELNPFIEDPSPKVRLTLASALLLHTDRRDVKSFLLRMLARERRYEVRNLIIEALSSNGN